MVYELGHVDDRFKNNNNNNNNIAVGDPWKEGRFVGNLYKKRPRCGVNNVNKFIGNIAKNYMETTEGENWASNLITHLNCRFPTSIDNPKNFIQQEVQDANLHQIISSHSSLPDLLVSNSLFLPQNDMNLGYSCYSSASLNIYNPILCGESAHNEYNVAYGGVNLISPLGVPESDLDIITSPEQVSSITACSYGDMISDTEAFDSITANSSFQQPPFHNSQYRNFSGNNRSAYNMDHPLLSVDDVQSPYTNPCNVQQNFQNLAEACNNLQNKSNNQESFQPQIQGQQHIGLESSSDVYDSKVLSSYVLYKCMPANLRKDVSFQNYMHASECQENLCKCHLHLELSSHFDKCKYLDCNICGPVRSLCGVSIDSFLLESRKRKFDQSEVTNNMGLISTGTLLDALPTKYPKLESLTVRENAMDDEQRRKVNDAHDQQESTVVYQTNNIVNNEMMKYSKLESSSVGENAMDDDQRRKVYGSHDQPNSTVVNQSDNIANVEMMRYPKLGGSAVPENAMDDDQRRVVSGSQDQQELIAVHQSNNTASNEMMKHSKLESSTVREDAMDDDQRVVVNGAHDQKELIVVNQSDDITNDEMMKYSKLESSKVGADTVDDDQRGVVNGAHDQQILIVVNQSDDIANNEMMKYSRLESSKVGDDTIDDDQRGVVNGAHEQQELTVVNQSDIIANNEMMNYPVLESSTVGEDAMDDAQRRKVNGAHDQQELKVVDRSDDIANNDMVKYRKLESSTVGEDAMDDDQRRKVNGAHDQQGTTVDGSTVGKDVLDDDQRREVDGANDQQELPMVNQSDTIANNEMMKYAKLDASTVGENVMDDDQRREVNGGNDQQELTVVNQSDTMVNNEMTTDEKEKSGQAMIEENDNLNSVVDVVDLNSIKSLTPDVSMVDCESALGSDHTKIKIASLTDSEMTKSPHLCSDNLSSKEMAIDEEEKSGQAIVEASNDLNSGADVADLNSNASMSPNVSMVDCDSFLGSDHTETKNASLTDNEMMQSAQLCSDSLSSKEMTIVEQEKSDQAIAEASDALNSGADVADSDLISVKSLTPNVSMVDSDSALGSDHTKIKVASLTDNKMMKSPQLCSDNLSLKEMTVDEKENSGQAIIEASDDLNTAVDMADLNPIKSMTQNVSVVDCNSALESNHAKIKNAPLADNEMMKSLQLCSDHLSSEEMAIDVKEKFGQAIIEASNGLSFGADVADLNSNKSITPNVSMVDCDSVLKQDNTKIKITSLTDKDSPLEPEKIKIQSVSLADFFTADQIKEHLLSFTSQKVVSENRTPSIGPNTCQLCSMDKLVFAPAPIYCSSCDTRIKRNVGYYRSTNVIGTRHFFCMSCYRGSHGNNILLRGYGYSIPKSNLQKARNDEEKEDSWVLCDKCQCWQHRICGLYNDEKDVEGKAEYICPKCYLEEMESGIRVPLPQTTASGAKDLPRTNLSDHIEQRLSKRLNQERQEMAKVSGIEPDEVPGAEGLVVRVVVSVEKQLEVRQKFINILHGEDYPSGFTYRSKLIFLFQKIEGVDVCLFGMCVQEFGSECGGPNRRCVYISYLDSVKYFRPERKCMTGESLRTFVYHEILTGYLEYCKKRGFATCYIWACPLIKGEDYIFYCHPETQRTPKQDKLRQWYKLMLKKATEDNIVVDHTNLYNQFFVPGGEGNMKITAARLPYFDGDYWSGAAENIVRKLEVEESAGGLQSKLPNKRILKAMGQDKTDIAVKDVLVMQKLGQTILPVKENFMIVHLQYICTHCHEVILSGSRWFCSHCKKFQLCSRCFNADKNISVSKLHTCHSGERNELSEVVVSDVTLDTKDTDDVVVNSFFETRDAFLNKCQKSHFQFDTLSRAKYSSMMILYHLIYKPVIKPTCTACHADVMVELCWHCDTCTKYNICESCYKMRHGAYHPHSLNPPSMDIECASKSELLQLQKDWPLRFVLDTLMHASECDRIPCAYKECNTMRRLFYHAVRCSVKARNGCKYCQRVWMILKLHSQICTDSDCKIPRCMDIKKHKEMLAARRADQQVTMNDQQEVAAEVHVG